MSSSNNNDNNIDEFGNKVESAAVTEEDTSRNSARGSTRVTIEDGIETHDNANDSNVRHRVPFVSRHRHTLNRIASDSVEHRKHSVPNQKNRVAAVEQGPVERPYKHQLSNNSSDESDRLIDGNEKIYKKYISKVHKDWSEKSKDDWVATIIPAWSWLKTYNVKETLMADLIAGLTVGIMIVPQSMSYAKLAGLPVEFGLYSALIPVYAYAFFGTSRQLAVGPVALISLLLSTGLTYLLEDSDYEPKTPEYAQAYQQLAIQTSLLVGVTYIVMGLCRMGFVTIFLSHAVISGFTTGAAVIIGMSQVKYLFGYDVGKSDRLHEVLEMIFADIDQFNYRTFIMGTASILMLVLFKNLGKTYKQLKFLRAAGPLIVTVIAIILTVALDLQDKKIPVVGSIPKGFPSVTINKWSPIEADFGKMFVIVISIVIVGFMESVAIAKQLASKHKYDIDASKELVGLGVSNFFGSVFNAYPVTGSFSRSAVNNDTGAKSGISGIVTATIVCVTLLFLTPIFEKLPLNTLAAIVISGVLGLLDYEEAMHLWKVHKFDFLVWLIACICTMFLGVEMGLATAVGVSLLIVVYESAYPQTSVLGRLPGTSHYRNIKQYPEVEQYDGIVIMRIDAPLYFANAQNVREKIRKYRKKAEAIMEAQNGSVKYLILEMSPVSHIDTSALHQLDFMIDNYRSRGQELVFANPSMRVMGMLEASGLVDKIGEEYFHASLHDAVHWCLTNMDCEAVSIHEGSADGREEEEGSDMLDVEIATESEP